MMSKSKSKNYPFMSTLYPSLFTLDAYLFLIITSGGMGETGMEKRDSIFEGK